jgi:hypothetical protein
MSDVTSPVAQLPATEKLVKRIYTAAMSRTSTWVHVLDNE